MRATWRETSRPCWKASSLADTGHGAAGAGAGCTSRKVTERRLDPPSASPTFEDKVLQRAVAMVLEAIYEQDFLDCSYGFRPGRSAHDALEALWKSTMTMGGGWIVE